MIHQQFVYLLSYLLVCLLVCLYLDFQKILVNQIQINYFITTIIKFWIIETSRINKQFNRSKYKIMLKKFYLVFSIYLSCNLLVNSFFCQKFLRLHNKEKITEFQEMQSQFPSYYSNLVILALIGYIIFIFQRLTDYFNVCQVYLCIARIFQFFQALFYSSSIYLSYQTLFGNEILNQFYEDYQSIDSFKDSQETLAYLKSYSTMIQVLQITFYTQLVLVPLIFIILIIYHKLHFKLGTFYKQGNQVSEHSFVQQIDENVETAERQ
ncbi:transmembrane protein, putative (macronuclear) [Tetrahymena thermophila SB210]|uniref:Transmembrane protein, putative n=1 Tax=Tetrahymena thermophila (strain SB210) TaxID=312017 RepID=A4VF34_TETTS|nr:transmembrane protein, putative [Tetrahymena thermophila SB210]EDK31217.1 transmembrane protein, putative [Tetrahymena thermophila SB210]|eukprot:XP_001470621.1 transmembrane protein, putative [Tetrahymena thermophila SB210]